MKKTKAEMYGELLRDAGILVLVFGNLDMLLKSGWDTDPRIMAAVNALGLLFVYAGVKIELGRNDHD